MYKLKVKMDENMQAVISIILSKMEWSGKKSNAWTKRDILILNE